MRKSLLLAVLVLVFTGCQKPVQWKEKKCSSQIEFMGFTKESAFSTVKSQLEKWNLNFKDTVSFNSKIIDTYWIKWQNVNYEKIRFYFKKNDSLEQISIWILNKKDFEALKWKFQSKYSLHKEEVVRSNYYEFKDKNEDFIKMFFDKDNDFYKVDIFF